MRSASINDTAAYKIIRQITDHIWGSETKLSDERLIAICQLFRSRGFDWQSLMDGSMSALVGLEKCIESVIKYGRIAVIASVVANRSSHT